MTNHAKNNEMQTLYDWNGYCDRNTCLNPTTTFSRIQTILAAEILKTLSLR